MNWIYKYFATDYFKHFDICLPLLICDNSRHLAIYKLITMFINFQKYEDEKSENEKLRKELEDTKKSLLEAKAELDKVMKQREVPRNSDRVGIFFYSVVINCFRYYGVYIATWRTWPTYMYVRYVEGI